MKSEKIVNFRDLDVWKTGMEIAKAIYSITETFPKNEKYGLSSQLRKAGISVPSNIAEGFNRFHNKEYRQFLYVALGSIAEIETQVELGFDFGFVSEKDKNNLLEKLLFETKMLRNLIKKL